MSLGDYNTTTGAKNKYNTVTGKLVSTSSGSSGGGSSSGSSSSSGFTDNYGTTFSTQAAANTSNQQNAYYNANPTVLPPTSDNRNQNAAAIQQFADIKLPDTTPDTGNTSLATAGTSSISTFLENMQKQNDANEKARVDAEKLRATENQSMLSKLLGSTTSPSDARTAAEAKTGVNVTNYFAEEKAKIAEIGSLTEEYNAVKAAKDAQIATTQDRMGSMNFINNQTAQIERNAAPKLNELSANINSKAAVLQASQGMFNEAQSYISQAVADSTADTKYKMDLFTTFYTVNQDSIDRLDKIYQDAFKTSMDLATVAYTQQVDEKTKVGELMLTYTKAGISISDTLEQALKKAGLNSYSLENANTQSLINDRNTTTANQASTTYSVKNGDTLTTIASKLGLTIDTLSALNPGIAVNNLQIGQKLNTDTSKLSKSSSAPSTAELTQFIYKQIATTEFKSLSTSDKKLYIQSQGGNPADFGY